MLNRIATCLFVSAALLIGGVAPLLAQSAPAGNDHPQTRMLSQSGEVNPFGVPPAKSSMDQAAKITFAKQVNIEALRNVQVYHNGRLKILDSLSRETVADITGRKTFQDLVAEKHGTETKYAKVGYDPLFTFLDIIIDPSYYEDKPLIGVTYLPLRERILDLSFPGEAQHAIDVRETWKRFARLTPVMVGSTMQQIAGQGQLSQPMAAGLADVREGLNTFLGSAGNLLMVPVTDPGKPWLHLAQLPAGSPAQLAVTQLGDAWRKGDVAGVNAASTQLYAELAKIAPGGGTTLRGTLEALYNKTNPFEYGYWFYAGALIFLLLAFGTGRPGLKIAGLAMLVLAVLAHGFGFFARCYIAERFAIQNQFESMTGLSLFATTVGLTLAIAKRQLIFAAATAAVGFMVLIVATQTGIPGKDIGREAAILNTSVLLKYHVTTVLLSYGLISLGFILSLFYLAMYYGSRVRTSVAVEPAMMATSGGAAVFGGASGSGPGGGGSIASVAASALGLKTDAQPNANIRVLGDLDKAQITLMQLAFWTLGVGILLGAWWADHSWGRWWAFDPKELWALLTWLVYLIVVHVRVAGVKERGKVTAWLSVVGFCVMLFCYFGVNLLLPGLHAYA